MSIEILQKEHPVLRQKCKDVPIEEITSKKIQAILKKMSSALAKEEDGVAIAAPQIGAPLRIFLVSAKYFGKKDQTDDLVFINPEIIKLSRERHEIEEGCLSARYLYGLVLRSIKATVRAYNERGKPFQRGASGLLAQIFQHEVDHLNGILFTDKAKNVKDLPPVKIKR